MRKQKGESFNLNNYRRHVPKSRMPLSETTLQIIKSYLDKNSRQSYTGEKNILEITKRAIFRKLNREFPSIKLSYSSYMKHCPKEYKLGSRRTDVCGICKWGRNMHKINYRELNNEKKVKYDKWKNGYLKHRKIVETQREQY